MSDLEAVLQGIAHRHGVLVSRPTTPAGRERLKRYWTHDDVQALMLPGTATANLDKLHADRRSRGLTAWLQNWLGARPEGSYRPFSRILPPQSVVQGLLEPGTAAAAAAFARYLPSAPAQEHLS